MQDPPKIIAGRYERLEPIGEGGQGKVYRARHVELGRIYALKLMKEEGGEAGGRFRREGWALARLSHPHILQVFDLGRDGDFYYLVMEFVDGPTLKKLLESRGRLPLPDALEIARQVADALAYAHTQPYEGARDERHTGMIHRDVKPSNILLRGRTPIDALLADFGLVKLSDGERTTTGAMMGTVRYSAPEQLGLRRGREKVPVDFRADVFAFGLVLYEMLEGRQFHAGREPVEVLAHVLHDREELVPEFTQALPRALKALVARAVHRFPDDRYPSMAAVKQELETIIADLDVSTDDEIEQQIHKLEKQRTRRAAQTAQSARQQARDAGAPELVAEGFEAAVRQQEDASLALGEGRSGEAREKYEVATRLYERLAIEAASVRAAREAEQAQEAMRTARLAAEGVGAAELADAAFARARQEEDAAEARRAAGAHGEAADLFARAARGFEQAGRDAARERQRRTAAAARDATRGVHAASERADTPRYAPERFEEAEKLLLEAEARFRAEAFEAAAAEFERVKALLAQADVESAAARVREEEARKQAAAARTRAETARAGADAAQAAEHARELYQRAAAAFEAAEGHLGAAGHDEAVRGFETAADLFTTAGRRSLWVRAVAAETEARRALAEADAVGAARYAPEPWGEGNSLLEQAGASLGAADNEAARAAFEQVAARFARATEVAKEVRRKEEEAAEARRRAQEEARRRTRQAAEQALAAAVAARQKAEQAGAPQHTPELHAEGVAEIAAAERALSGEAYDAARASLSAAVATFERAAAEASRRGEARRREEGETRRRAEEKARRRARREAEEALAGAVAARDKAERAQAPDHAAGAHAEGVAAITEAGKALAAGAYDAVRERAAEALAAFGHAIKEAERIQEARRREEDAARRRADEARRREADEARRRVTEHTRAGERKAAEEGLATVVAARDLPAQAAAPPYAPELNAQASAVVRAADKELAAKDATVRAGAAEAVAPFERVVPEADRRKSAHAGAEDVTVLKPQVKPLGRPQVAVARSRPRLYAGAAALLAVVAGGAWYLSRTPGPAAPTALAWDQTLPQESEISVKAGEAVRFEAHVRDDPARRVHPDYVWTLDGKQQARGPVWDYTAARDQAGKRHKVEVVASAGDASLPRQWQLDVQAVNRRPVISGTKPARADVQIAQGREQEFSVAAEDPDPGDKLTYVWKLNGEVAASGVQPSWKLREPKNGDEVQVTVTDQAGESAPPRSWRVSVETPMNHPPKIVAMNPPTKTVPLEEGKRQDFTLRVEDVDKDDRLAYVWSLDDSEVGRGRSYELKAPPAAEGKSSHRVEVAVSDQAGATDRAAWGIEVTPAKPVIVEARPSGQEVRLTAGETTTMEVNARAGDPGASLRYEWAIDGRAQATSSPRLRLPSTLDPGQHVVEAAAVDARGPRSEPYRWTVSVAKATPSATTAPPVASARLEITEADARDWLSRFGRAWETKDGDSLVALGVLNPAQAGAIRQKLVYDFRVSTVIQRFEPQGSQATLVFTRTDTLTDGKVLPTIDWTCKLEKGPRGVSASGGCRRTGP